MNNRTARLNSATGQEPTAPQPVKSVPGSSTLMRVNVPALSLQKVIKVNDSDNVWSVKKILLEKIGTREMKHALNHGFYIHGIEGKQGKFMDDRKEISLYKVDTNVILPNDSHALISY